MGVYTINRLAVIRLRSIILLLFVFLHKVSLSGSHKDVTKTNDLHFFLMHSNLLHYLNVVAVSRS